MGSGLSNSGSCSRHKATCAPYAPRHSYLSGCSPARMICAWVDINGQKEDRGAAFPLAHSTRRFMAPVGGNFVKLSVRFQMCVEDGKQPPARAPLMGPFWH